MPADHLDLLPTVSERKILSFGPERQQIGIVWTAGLARLPRYARRYTPVPISQVEYLAVRSAVHLTEVLVVPCIVRRVNVAWASNRAQIECRGVSRTKARQRMLKSHRVQLSPAPAGGVITEQLFRPLDGGRERLQDHLIALRDSVRAKQRFVRLTQLLEEHRDVAQVAALTASIGGQSVGEKAIRELL